MKVTESIHLPSSLTTSRNFLWLTLYITPPFLKKWTCIIIKIIKELKNDKFTFIWLFWNKLFCMDINLLLIFQLILSDFLCEWQIYPLIEIVTYQRLMYPIITHLFLVVCVGPLRRTKYYLDWQLTLLTSHIIGTVSQYSNLHCLQCKNNTLCTACSRAT